MADSARIEELRRRVQSDPASIAFAALAEEYRRAGQFDTAIETCRVGLQRHSAYLSARVTLGRSLMEVGEFDDARDELEYVLRVAPENLAAIRGLAEIHYRRREQHDASDYHAAIESAHRTGEAGPAIAAPEAIETSDAAPAAPIPVGIPVAVSEAEPAVVVEFTPRPSPAQPPAVAAVEASALDAAPGLAPALIRLEVFLAAIQAARASTPTATAPGH